MSETLSRIYHGYRIVSTVNDRPIDDSDGWTHLCDGQSYLTLSKAISAVKQAKNEKTKRTKTKAVPKVPSSGD